MLPKVRVTFAELYRTFAVGRVTKEGLRIPGRLPNLPGLV